MAPARKKRLRSGYTTGACAAAAAKAAALHLLGQEEIEQVEIPFPDGSRHRFTVHRVGPHPSGGSLASVIKDAGDDPDVTNGAEIGVIIDNAPQGSTKEAFLEDESAAIIFRAGEGVGTVTKAGLALAKGEPAINPVPRKMILAAVGEALGARGVGKRTLQLTITVAHGRQLAEKTLNHRLGVLGGLSILGTTGIVRPISAAAWTATISASMDVAWENGCREIVISTGRTSERAAQRLLRLPEEAYAMMGDYLHFSLNEAKKHHFTRLHLSAMWAKIVKAAMEIPQTHVRHGALEADRAASFISGLAHDPELYPALKGSNTAREIFIRLQDMGRERVIYKVLQRAKSYAEKVSGLAATVYLVDSNGKVIARTDKGLGGQNDA